MTTLESSDTELDGLVSVGKQYVHKTILRIYVCYSCHIIMYIYIYIVVTDYQSQNQKNWEYIRTYVCMYVHIIIADNNVQLAG